MKKAATIIAFVVFITAVPVFVGAESGKDYSKTLEETTQSAEDAKKAAEKAAAQAEEDKEKALMQMQHETTDTD